jgi:hypothetical protein
MLNLLFHSFQIQHQLGSVVRLLSEALRGHIISATRELTSNMPIVSTYIEYPGAYNLTERSETILSEVFIAAKW